MHRLVHDAEARGGNVVLKRVFIIVCSVLILPYLSSQPLQAASTLTADEARVIAAEAFVYGFAPVLLESYRQARMPLLGGTNRMMYVGSPDVRRTMGYYAGYMDLLKEPMVLCLTDMPEQRVMFEVMDAYADVAPAPGTPPPGNSGCLAVTGPGWKGRLPQGTAEVKSPTSGAWIFGRTLYKGTREEESLKAFKDLSSLTPLSLFTKGIRTAPISTEAGLLPTSPLRQVLLMDMQAFFGRLALFMKRTPPPAADAAITGRMARIGVDTRTGFFDTTGLGPGVRKAIEQGMNNGMDEIRHHARNGFPKKGGWIVVPSPATYGRDYLLRSTLAYVNLGEPLARDAAMAFCRMDAGGTTLNGKEKYVLRLGKARPPLNHAHWSLTVLDSDLSPLPRRVQHTALNSLDGLQADSDGTIEVFIQKDSPGPGRESNWLQMAEGDFTLMLRMYWPEGQIPDGGYTYPSVTRMEE